MIANLRDDEFDHFVDRPGISLVEFWAEWCTLCKQMEQVLRQLDEAYATKVRIAKVNVEHEQATAEKFEVQSLPTLLIYKGGTLIGRVTGYVPFATLEEALKNVLEE